MTELYNNAYSRKLSGLSGKIGGTIELFFMQRMMRYAYFRDTQAIIDQYGPPKRVNAHISVTFESGAVKEGLVHAPRTLEIGCNDGYFLERMAHPKNSGWGIYGVDINEVPIKEIVENNKKQAKTVSNVQTALSVGVMDMQALQFDDASFRIVLARHVLEHVPDPAKGIEEIVRVTEPGGVIQLSYPYEPIRGIAAVPSAIAATGNPFDSRKLHLHKLNPHKVDRLFDPNYIFGAKSLLVLTPYPVWLHVFLRNDAVYSAKDYTPFSQRVSK